jgi:cytochrome c556
MSKRLAAAVGLSCCLFGLLLVERSLGQNATSEKTPTNAATPTKERPRQKRVKAPQFKSDEFKGVFFEDVASQLVGSLPASTSQSVASTASTSSGDDQASEADNIWKQRIDAAVIEDLIKSSKLRLDAAISSPAKFTGGGYDTARMDFTMLSILFGVIENYPGDVRWKHSAAKAKADFGRIAANAKVGTTPVYNEAKAKNQSLSDLLNGGKLEAVTEPATWSDSVERTAAMKMIEWVVKEKVNPIVASDASFGDSSEDMKKFAQLIATTGEVLLQEGMMDQDSDEYQQWSKEMIAACEAITAASEKKDLTQTREAISRLNKSCDSCHEGFR